MLTISSCTESLTHFSECFQLFIFIDMMKWVMLNREKFRGSFSGLCRNTHTRSLHQRLYPLKQNSDRTGIFTENYLPVWFVALLPIHIVTLGNSCSFSYFRILVIMGIIWFISLMELTWGLFNIRKVQYNFYVWTSLNLQSITMIKYWLVYKNLRCGIYNQERESVNLWEARNSQNIDGKLMTQNTAI